VYQEHSSVITKSYVQAKNRVFLVIVAVFYLYRALNFMREEKATRRKKKSSLPRCAFAAGDTHRIRL